MGFVSVKQQAAHAGSASAAQPAAQKSGGGGATYLQKTLKGGIILIELCCCTSKATFAVTVYAFEYSRLPHCGHVNAELTRLFTDECDRFKDLTHLHSFAYDFHLSLVQSFIRGEQKGVLGADYPLAAFLSEVNRFFPSEPCFSWNSLYEGTIVLPSGGSTGQQVFDYMLRNESMYNACTIHMLPYLPPPPQDSTESPLVLRESALLLQLPELRDVRRSSESVYSSAMVDAELRSFHVGLVVTLDRSPPPAAPPVDSRDDASGGEGSISLRYWLVVSNRRPVAPQANREKKLVVHSSAAPKPVYIIASCPVKGSGYGEEGAAERLKAAKLDYLCYSNAHQTPLRALLPSQVHLAVSKVADMVEQTHRVCHLTFLWQRLLAGGTDGPLQRAGPSSHLQGPPGKQGRRGSEEGRTDRRPSNESRVSSTGLLPLSYAEFEDLLGLVDCFNVSATDARLGACLRLTCNLCASLVRSLAARYPDTHRLFACGDATTATPAKQYLVVLNPSCLNVCSMLTIHSNYQVEVSVISCDADNAEINPQSFISAPSRGVTLSSLDSRLAGDPIQPRLATHDRAQHTESFINTCAMFIWASLAAA